MSKYVYLLAYCCCCWLAPALGSDVRELADVRQLVEAHGFKVEELEVVTGDGYILGLQRIVNPLVRAAPAELKTVVLLHGLLSSSADWVMNAEPELRAELWAEGQEERSSNSLALHLANRGYNVLLANLRGNGYGLRHQWMTQEERRFWSFSLDELIGEDLPAIIRFAQEHYAPLASGKKVAFVGHSLGAKLMLGLLSERPEFGQQLEPVLLLAPSANLGNVRTPARSLTQYTFLFEALEAKFPGSAFARNYLAQLECPEERRRRAPGACHNLLFLVVGFEEQNLEGRLLDTYLAHVPQPTSVRLLCHLSQEVQSGAFARFDFGLFGNLARYHSLFAPAYELQQIKAPSLALFHADRDWISGPRDLDQLVAALGEKPLTVFNMSSLEPNWSHLDFVYGRRTGELLNKRLERLIGSTTTTTTTSPV